MTIRGYVVGISGFDDSLGVGIVYIFVGLWAGWVLVLLVLCLVICGRIVRLNCEVGWCWVCA